jgi:hypothetical protein
VIRRFDEPITPLQHIHCSSLFFLAAFVIALIGCSKDAPQPTVGSRTAGTIDTSEKVPEVAITDTNHHLFFRPKVGAVYRFHVADKIVQTMSDDQGGQNHTQNGGTTTEYYVRETINSVGPDSSVLVTLRIDSISATMTRDTQKVAYSSDKTTDRADRQFLEFNIIVGKDFTVKVNKYGDLSDIPDVTPITNALLTTAPDSVRNRPDVKAQATRQAQMVANSYAMRVVAHNPTRKIIKDTTWKNTSELNLDFAPGLSFPVTVDATESIKAIEKRNNKVIVALQDHSATTPKKKVFDEANVKATINDFLATSDGIVRLEDATGVVFHRLLEEKRRLTFTVESKQSPAQKRVLKQSSTENMIVEQLP